MYEGFFKPIGNSLVGVMVLTGIIGVNPHPSMAQLPSLENTAPVSPNPNPIQPNPAYALGGGDRVTIDVFEVPQYSGEYQIPIDGVLFLPLIGGVQIEGLTVEQASNAIAARYSRYLKRPIITVRLLSPRALNVFVAGEVSRPGSYSLALVSGAGDRPGAQYPTLTQAIQLAGGVTLAADLCQVQLRRRVVGTTNSSQLVTYDLRELLRTGNQRQDLTLRDGDSIFIPTATNVSLAETRQIGALGFAANPSKPRTISVVGEVNRPGTYIVTGVATENGVVTGITGAVPTVAQAIKQAGGIRPLADIRRIQLRRLTKLGTEQILDVNLYALLQTGDVSQDAILQEGDTVVVPKAADIPPAEATELATASFSPDTIQITVVGEVQTPGLIRIPPNSPLNQGLLAAGGFNTRRARRSDIELVRLNPDGSVSKRTVPINFAQGINEESNPTLRNNDIIIVRRSNTASITDSISTFLSPVSAVADLLGIPGQTANILDLLGIISPNND